VNDILDIPFPTEALATIITDTHIYFSSSLLPYSNFYYCKLKVAFTESYDAETYIMSIPDPIDMLRAVKRLSVDNS